MIRHVLLILIISTLVLTLPSEKLHSNPCGQLYLTQSPDKKRYLELNWSFTCQDPPDTIVLTHGNPNTNNAIVLYKTFPGAVLKGHHLTNISFSAEKFPGNWDMSSENPNLHATCFDYYITSARNNELVYVECISIQPTWMENFGNLRIGNMMIPGTHNSGAYKGGLPFIRNYVLNQNRNLWEQLVYGIRYFDIRIGRYSDGLYINHGFVKCSQLVPELESVAKFLRHSPREVVILNFYRFPQPQTFPKSFHLEVVNAIKSVFKELIYPYVLLMHRKGPKLSDFWKSGRRVIVSYRNDEIIRENSWIWPSVRRHWGNIQSVQQLENYVKFKTSRDTLGNPMSVIMAELTPNCLTILKHVTRNLKVMSVLVNREMSQWLRDDNRCDNLNIIATDFFNGNDVINLAIETNFRKLNNFIYYALVFVASVPRAGPPLRQLLKSNLMSFGSHFIVV